MKRDFFTKVAIITACLMGSFGQFYGQCNFTGLLPNYCTNSPASGLIPGIPGGVFSGPGIVGTSFSPASAGSGTHTITYNICSTTYSITTPPFAPLTTAGTAVVLADDQVSGSLPVGFNFIFYCNTYNAFYISSNGFITFSGNGNAGCCAGAVMPSGTTPDNLVAAAWTDLHPPSSVGGSITYTTIGIAPIRTLVVSYNAINHYNGANYCCPLTTQILLMETTNIIEIHTTTKPLPLTQYNTTMGIQNVNSTLASVVPGRNSTSNWTATNEAYRWSPGATCNVSSVTVVSPSTISVVGNNSICIGATSTLIASGNTTYTWSTSSNNSSITVSPTSNTTYTVGGTNSFGCVANSAITVTVDNTPTVTASAAIGATNGICPLVPVSLVGSGATAYSWSGGISNGLIFNPVVSNTYIVTGSNACGSATAAVSISVHPAPNITGSVNNPTVCTGNPVIFIGNGGVSYNWNNGVTNNVSYTPAVTATYVVIGSSAQGCTNTAAVGVTVFITPTISPVATPTAICVGKTATVSATGALNGYTWTTVPVVNTSTMAVSPITTTTYTVLRASGSCTSTSNVTVVVNPLPNLLVGPPSPSIICAGDCATVTAIGAIGYTWYPGGFPSGVTQVCPNASTEYTVLASNANCTISATSSLTVIPNPTIAITASAPNGSICEGSAFTMTASGASTYTWASPIVSAQQNQASVSDSPVITSQYFVSGSNAQGCVSTSNYVIIVGASPNLTTSVLNPGGYICAGGIGTLQAAGVSPVNYNWVPIGFSGATATVNPITTTAYTVIGTNPTNSCSSVGTVTLAVYISTFVVSSPTAVCKGSTATISAVGAANSYSWNVPFPNNNDSIFVSPQSTTIYNVAGSTGSCTTTKTVNLIVNPLPPVSAVANKLTICRFEPGVLTGSGANIYLWSGGTATAVATNPTYTVFPTITSNFILTGTDLNGCAKTVTVTQYVNVCLGIDEQNGIGNLLTIYPNPNNGEFTIRSETAMNISIVNELGQVVKTLSVKEKESPVKINNLANGIYFILAEKDGKTGSKKMVINK